VALGAQHVDRANVAWEVQAWTREPSNKTANRCAAASSLGLSSACAGSDHHHVVEKPLAFLVNVVGRQIGLSRLWHKKTYSIMLYIGQNLPIRCKEASSCYSVVNCGRHSVA
jgi:hypothetical protein